MAFASPLTKDDELLKPKYAAALLRESELLKAAQLIFPGQANLGKAMYAVQFWTLDDEVVAEKARLVEKFGELSTLPSKAKVAKDFHDIFKDEDIQTKDRIAAGKVYAQLMGYLTPQDGSGDGTQAELPLTPTYQIVDK